MELGNINTISNGVPYSLASTTSNLPSFNSTAVTSREISLGTDGVYTWLNTQTFNTVLATINVPGVLASNPQIAALKDSYSYFKCNIKFRFRLSCSMFDSGMLYAYYKPYAMTKMTHSWGWSGMNHLLISTAPGAVAELIVPYVFDERFSDTAKITSSDSTLGQVFLAVGAPLVNNDGSATSSATINITMTAIDLEFYMPQSKSLQESNSKAIHDSISDAFSIASDVVATVNSASCGNIPAAVGGVSKIVRKMAIMDKPVSLSRTNIIKQDPFDLNNSHGLYTGQLANSNFESRTSSDPRIMGSTSDDMDLLTVASTPMLITYKTLVGKGVLQISSLSSEETAKTYSYVDWISKNFVHYRGSYKFKIYFSSNVNIKARCVIYVGPPTTPSKGQWFKYPHRIVDVQGSCDVEFTVPYIDTHLALESNGSDRRLYLEVIGFDAGTSSTATVYAHVYKAAGPDFQWSTPACVGFHPESCPRLDFAKHFEMLAPGMGYYHDQNMIDGYPTQNVKELLMKDVPYYIIDGSDTILTDTAIELVDTVNEIPSTANTAAGPAYVGIEKWACLYQYFRGSVGARVVNPMHHQAYMTALHPAYIPDGGTTTYLPYTAVASSNNPCPQILVPFISKKPFLKLWVSSNTTFPFLYANPCIGTSPAYDRFVFKFVGDDFAFGQLRPPPQGVFKLDTGYDNWRYFLRNQS